MDMRFSWDQVKARRNLRTHGISFEAAAEVFSDPCHITTENYFIGDEGEQRYATIGMTRDCVLLLVVFVERTEAEARNEKTPETIHIISARKAQTYETKIYSAHLGN
jgi:uncharacterized DUF497 family protein